MSGFEFSSEVIAHLAERRGTLAKILIWFEARNRDTGAREAIGFWTGDDHQEFLISDQIRTYYGSGSVLDVPAIILNTGFDVRQLRVRMAPFSDEVRQLLHNFEASNAKVEIHSVVFHSDSKRQIGNPRRVFKGQMTEAPLKISRGGESSNELVLINSLQGLTRGLPLRKSNTELQRVHENERGREYADTTADWSVRWGF